MIAVIYPQSVNWFYERLAAVIVEELRGTGFEAESIPSSQVKRHRQTGDTVMVINFAETLSAATTRDESEGLRRKLLSHDRRILINLDCISTSWFESQVVFGPSLFTDIFDIGMIRQSDRDHILGIHYRWIPEALTVLEIGALGSRQADRPLPWAIVGHQTKDRASFIAAALQSLPANGFVYAPKLRPFNSGSGLDEGTMARVLKRTDFFIWGSHHHHRYHECLRALAAIKNGAIPVKIDPMHYDTIDLPWVYSSFEAFKRSPAYNDPKRGYAAARDRILANGTLGRNLAKALDGGNPSSSESN